MSDSRSDEPCAPSGCEWLSAHLLFSGDIYGDRADAVVRHVIEPFVEESRRSGLLRNYFFVRYGDPPHVRLRLFVPNQRREEVASALTSHVQPRAPETIVALLDETREPFALAPPDTDRPNAALVDALRWIAYEPEFDRYGGPYAMDVVERIFVASSDLAVHFLRDLDHASRAPRLGRGALAFLVTAHAFMKMRDEASTFASYFAASYLSTLASAANERTWQRAFHEGVAKQRPGLATRLRDTWSCLEAGEETLPVLSTFSTALAAECECLMQLCIAGSLVVHGRRLGGWRECVASIVPSIMHMTNNRLGITIPEEAYIAYLVRWALEDPLRGR